MAPRQIVHDCWSIADRDGDDSKVDGANFKDDVLAMNHRESFFSN